MKTITREASTTLRSVGSDILQFMHHDVHIPFCFY